MFQRVMVANRGEIALRILRSLREMEVEGVLACSVVDAAHPPLLADRVICIGPAEVEGSYLNSYELLNAAAACGADAIHPGYGFLSEDAGFARLCGEMGMGFVGPSPGVMESLDDKSAVCRSADELGIPTLLLGVAGEEKEAAAMAREAGYPVVLKPLGGGGGRGIRTVAGDGELPLAWQQANLEAAASCRRGGIYVERYLPRARHLEVQVAGDASGRVITFPPRDCSLQRRYQKWIEETPPPQLPAALEGALRRDACRFIQACGLTGIATVEFLAVEEDYFFLEVNARLQVEHTVTELLTGLDLVKEQLRLAAGGAPGAGCGTPRARRASASIYYRRRYGRPGPPRSAGRAGHPGGRPGLRGLLAHAPLRLTGGQGVRLGSQPSRGGLTLAAGPGRNGGSRRGEQPAVAAPPGLKRSFPRGRLRLALTGRDTGRIGMDFLSGMGEMMRREGLDELEIRDADRVIVLRRNAGAAAPREDDAGPGVDEGLVTTPLGGILYLHPGSGKEPYAEPGQRKAPGDILFCIEAMKHINEVYAEYDLTVEEILAGEGEAVSPRQAIMRIRREET